MNATTVAIDLAKDVFQLAIADENLRLRESLRLSRPQLIHWFAKHAVSRVIMEACGSAHFWARRFASQGIEVVLLPASYIRAYVRRNKTDAADAAALLEAARGGQITPVQVKSETQQALQSLHRIRSQWMATRTQRINLLRGLFREFGIPLACGARTGVENISRVLADPSSAIPELVRTSLKMVLEEIRVLEARVNQVECQLAAFAKQCPACKLLMSIPGIGLLNATAMVASTAGTVAHFQSARHFASWFGLTPKESSSGNSRFLGRISKRGDRYLRMLLTHGARSVLRAAAAARNKSIEPSGIRAWALNLQARSNHNKATCALANKIARICFAVLRDQQPFGQPTTRLSKKVSRHPFALAA